MRQKIMPDQWQLFNTKSLLGVALDGQLKYVEAEPLLLEGYEGMKQRENEIPSVAKIRITEANQSLVDLYSSWNKTEKAAIWQKKLNVANAKLKHKSEAVQQSKPLIAPRPKSLKLGKIKKAKTQ